MDSEWLEKIKEIEQLASEITEGKSRSAEKARKILELSKGLTEHIAELEETLEAIANDLGPRLLAPFVEYVHVDRARTLALAAVQKTLPDQARVVKDKFIAFQELQQVAEQHVNDGRDRDGELANILKDVIAGKLSQKEKT